MLQYCLKYSKMIEILNLEGVVLSNMTDNPLDCDTYRYLGEWAPGMQWKLAWRSRCFRVVLTYRLCRQTTGWRNWLARKAHALACQWAAIDLPESTEIGGGLWIDHGWGLVVNGRARIGRNVTLVQGVTIGGGSRIDEHGNRTTGYPVLEDGVTVGPNATIVGGITIGAGARILPGASVYFDVPPGALVGGNPGRIVRENVPQDTWREVKFDES
jgi:serine O-acetyltransferase